MTRHRSIPLVLAALALALGVVVSACGATSGTAVSVNGLDLSNQDFASWLRTISSNKQLGSQTTGVNSSTYSTGFTTGVLNTQVKYALIETELKRRHITLSASDLSTAETTVQQGLAPQTTDPSTGQAVAGTAAQGKALLDSLDASLRNVLIRSQAGETALTEVYAKQRGSTAALQKLYDANPSEFTNKACIKVIEIPASSGQTDSSGNPVAPTDSDYASALTEAKQVQSQITTQAASTGDLASTFTSAAAAVAQQEQLSNQGDLGCQAKGTYTTSVPALETAIWSQPVGQMSDPIKFAEGYLILFVSARGDLTFDDVKSELQTAAATQAQTDYSNWLAAAAKKADVTVDPQWGSWDRKTGTIVAPVGATSSSTSTTKASGLGSIGLGGSASTTTSTP